ncbi:MAG: 4-alpha-glucanotransferase, partial [Cyanobacteria bacterium HKST-UBA02]|nr:4-alpha-glucanotransferase [Cyanobacteria bacterium HKST-UBA02]
DHVLGFFRVYAFPWIPERNDEFVELTEAEAAAITGGKLPEFRPRPDEPEKNALLNKKQGVEILKAVCEAAGSGYIVAEDLGLLIPEYLRPALHDLGMAGFAIPIFERIEKTREFQPIDELHPLSLATYATHDHQPLASFYDGLVEWWHGPDGEEGWKEVRRLMKLLDLDPDNPPEQYDRELQEAFMKALMESPCWMAVFMVTDLIGSRLRFNQPGLSGSGCWTQRLPATLAALQADEETGRGIASLKELIESTGREPAAIASGSR